MKAATVDSTIVATVGSVLSVMGKLPAWRPPAAARHSWSMTSGWWSAGAAVVATRSR
jgi:hypothetical protein